MSNESDGCVQSGPVPAPLHRQLNEDFLLEAWFFLLSVFSVHSHFEALVTGTMMMRISSLLTAVLTVDVVIKINAAGGGR